MAKHPRTARSHFPPKIRSLLKKVREGKGKEKKSNLSVKQTGRKLKSLIAKLGAHQRKLRRKNAKKR